MILPAPPLKSIVIFTRHQLWHLFLLMLWRNVRHLRQTKRCFFVVFSRVRKRHFQTPFQWVNFDVVCHFPGFLADSCAFVQMHKPSVIVNYNALLSIHQPVFLVDMEQIFRQHSVEEAKVGQADIVIGMQEQTGIGANIGDLPIPATVQGWCGHIRVNRVHVPLKGFTVHLLGKLTTLIQALLKIQRKYLIIRYQIFGGSERSKMTFQVLFILEKAHKLM